MPIKLKVLLLIVISIVVILSVTIVSIVNLLASNDALTLETTKVLNALSFSRADHIGDVLEATLDQTKALSELDLFQNNLDNVVNGVGVEDSLADLQESLEDINDKTNAFYEISVSDNKGIVVASSSDLTSDVAEHVGNDISNEPYFIKGLKDPFISDAHLNEDVATVTYAHPIVTDDSNVPNGIIFIHQAFDKDLNGERGSKEGIGINNILLNPEGLGETGEAYLVNKDKLRITPDRHDLDDDVFLKQTVDTVGYENCFIEGIAGKPYINAEGNTVIGNAEPVKGTEWCILVEVGVEEAFAANKSLRNRSIIAGIIMVILSILASFFLARFVAKPINYLTNTVDEITKGKLEIQLKKSRISEINSLIESLSRILASMKLAILKSGKRVIEQSPVEKQPVIEKGDKQIKLKNKIKEKKKKKSEEYI